MTKDHEQWEELAAGYALNALEPEDEEVFLGHLRGCDLCGRALGDLHALTAQMAYAAEPLAPPESLRRRIMAEVGESGGGPLAAPAPVNRSSRPWQRESRYRPLVAAAAAAVTVFGLAVWNVNVRDQRDIAQADARRLRELVSVVSADGTAQARLASSGGARGTVYVRDATAWLVLDGVARNDRSASIYVLWWQDKAGALHPVAAFDVVRAGTNVVQVPITEPAEDIAALAVSHEAGRTMPERPSTVVASGTLRA